MASLNGVSSSNTVSSLMNSANMISGLASGLDTESMIENLVKSYQTKIESLNQKITKTEWKQDAYRDIISKMVGFSSKYTSYTSGSNLTSPGFFNSAVKVETLGLFADKVAASGKTSSEISLDRVSQLATSAQYRTASNLKAGDGQSIAADFGVDENGALKGLDLVNGTTELSKLSGSLTLTYGSKTVSVQFDEVKDVKALQEIKEKNEGISEDAALGKLIEQKLANEKITFSSGTTESADQRIGVKVSNGKITFTEKGSAGNGLYISGASGNVASTLGLNLSDASKDKPTVIELPKDMAGNYDASLTKNVNNAEYLSGKTMNLSLDGTVRQIKLPTIKDGKLVDADGKALKDADGKDISKLNANNYAAALNDAVQKAYKGAKIKVSNADESGETLRLRFDVQEGSDLIINTDVGETLGIGQAATSFLNTNKTLEDLLGTDKLDGLTAVKDKNGNDLLDDEGRKQYEFKINDVVVGKYTKDSKLSDILNDINSNKDANVTVSYSQTTKKFLFKSKETGLESEIKMGEGLAQTMFGTTEIGDQSGNSFAESYGVDWLKDGESAKFTFSIPGDSHLEFSITKETTVGEVVDNLNQSLKGYTFAQNKYTGQIEAKDAKSGAPVELKIKDKFDWDVQFDESKAPSIDYTPGQDAKFTVTVNGETKEMTRSSNSVNIDGLTITMKDTFDGAKDEDGKDAVDSAGRPKNSITFKSTTDSDKIVDAVKTMIEDYNTMMSEIKSAYATMPYQKSNGTFANYEPLTEDERQGMSESAIERYEEKAKQGILFGDRNLSSLYDKMRNAFAGRNEAALRSMGITISYSMSDGSQTVTLDESKLRDVLDSDPEKVTQVFTGETGVMQTMKTQLDMYSKTTGEPKGILIQQAGSPLSSLSLMNNSWQKEIDNYNTQIEKWQDKLSNQVDRYTQQFSRLEMLINQMNSQSSTLAGLMGG